MRSDIEWEDEISITLFMQELLHLCSTQPDRVLFNSFIFQELTIAYASRSHASIKSELEWNKTKPENEEVAPLNLQKMICDVVTDLECLWKERKMRTFGSSINLDNICYSSKSQKYWLENWADTYDKAMAVVSLVEDSDVHLASQDIAEELSAIGLTLIELKGINRAYIEKLRKNHHEIDENEYHLAVEKELFKYFDQEKEKELMRLILRLVSRDKRQLPTIDELKGIVSIEEIEERKGEELKNGEMKNITLSAWLMRNPRFKTFVGEKLKNNKLW